MTEWQSVPTEPTDAMLVAAGRYRSDPFDSQAATIGRIYMDMLAAAPPPPEDPRDVLIDRFIVTVSDWLSGRQGAALAAKEALAAARAWKERR